MAKKRDYSDFIQFVKENTNLKENDIIKSFREVSKKGIQKKRGLELIREVFGFEKGEKRGQTVKEKLNEKKAKDYVYQPAQPKPKVIKEKKPKQTGVNHYITLNPKLNKSPNQFLDMRSPTVKMLRKNITELYGYDYDTYIQIHIKIANDGYTQNGQFSALIPFNGKSKQGVKSVGQSIIQNLSTYYNNLAKRYNNARSTVNDMVITLKNISNKLKKATYLKEEDLKDLFNTEGVEIGGINIFTFTNN
jgi:hypothetical protein